jgi:hypothetical protein
MVLCPFTTSGIETLLSGVSKEELGSAIDLVCTYKNF